MSALIYDGGRHKHYTSSELARYMAALISFNEMIREIGPDDVQELSDRAAQSIAAQWLNGSEASQALATRGQVIHGACMSDFATQADYRAADNETRDQLDYLGTYLVRKHLDSF